jgi:hypothetical protein
MTDDGTHVALEMARFGIPLGYSPQWPFVRSERVKDSSSLDRAASKYATRVLGNALGEVIVPVSEYSNAATGHRN